MAHREVASVRRCHSMWRCRVSRQVQVLLPLYFSFPQFKKKNLPPMPVAVSLFSLAFADGDRKRHLYVTCTVTPGVHPMVASATSAVMILYTSFTATTSFVVFGLLEASDQSHTRASRTCLYSPPPLLDCGAALRPCCCHSSSVCNRSMHTRLVFFIPLKMFFFVKACLPPPTGLSFLLRMSECSECYCF